MGQTIRVIRTTRSAQPRASQQPSQPYPQQYTYPPQRMKNEEESSGCLCAFLGAFLGPIGIVIAAIIGKKGGVIASLVGMFIGAIIMIVLYFLFVGGSIAVMEYLRH